MITIAQAQNGLMRYIDAEILPHLTGAKKIGAGIYVALAARNLPAAIERYKTHPAIAVLGLFDGENIDIDAAYNAAMPLFTERQKVTIPAIGDITFDQSDVEKLYRYMRGE